MPYSVFRSIVIKRRRTHARTRITRMARCLKQWSHNRLPKEYRCYKLTVRFIALRPPFSEQNRTEAYRLSIRKPYQTPRNILWTLFAPPAATHRRTALRRGVWCASAYVYVVCVHVWCVCARVCEMCVCVCVPAHRAVLYSEPPVER